LTFLYTSEDVALIVIMVAMVGVLLFALWHHRD